jgi:hypothetical protein
MFCYGSFPQGDQPKNLETVICSSSSRLVQPGAYDLGRLWAKRAPRDTIGAVLEFLILSSVNEQVVLREWRKPVTIYEAPAPSDSRQVRLPDGWTVVTSTGYANAWVGDMPLRPEGAFSCDAVEVIKSVMRTPAWPVSSL